MQIIPAHRVYVFIRITFHYLWLSTIIFDYV
ncbi:protein of unknown function [Xenorhabdus poinarii G6]|uniref:Uncharacterized protein n=1 Tax=Xenorhabdus poinarii G6 TaxID=1354304 RepID=A0A068R3N0_9GAMM|nr:protein of unknown function [Xenorhabdus poinarii G6]